MVIRIASITLSLSGILALISGLLFWAGTGLDMVSLHMMLGLLAVGALWVIGFAQAFSGGGSWSIAFLAAAVGGLMIVIGFNQRTLLPGELHWIIQAFHLILGILTIGLGHMGAARYKKLAKLQP